MTVRTGETRLAVLSNFELPIQEDGRRIALVGEWDGDFVQPNGPEGKELRIPGELRLHFEDDVLTGTLATEPIINSAKKERTLLLFEFFSNGDHILLFYLNSDRRVKQFGVLFLSISASGNHLSGFAVGFGPESERTAYSMMTMERSAEI